MEKPGSKISKHNFSIMISEAWVSANPKEYSVWFYLQIRVQSVCPAIRKKILLLKVVWHTPFPILQPNVGFPATAFMDVEMESYILKELAMKVIHSTESLLAMYRPSGFDSPNCAGYLPAVRYSAIGDFLESPLLFHGVQE